MSELYTVYEVAKRLINNLVVEGRRVGKAPWCCDVYVKDIVAAELRLLYGVREREIVEETLARRKREEEWCLK